MSTRNQLRSLLMIWGLLLFVSCSSQKNNVVIFLVDDLGWNDLSISGSKFYETPNIDSFAGEGVSFSNSYAAHPRCVPSRYALWTGNYPAKAGIPGGASGMKAEELTIGEVLQEYGYKTFFSGKWHLGHEEELWPHHQGFDVNKGGCSAGAPKSYFYPYNELQRTTNHSARDIIGLDGVEDGTYITDHITDETIKFIKSNKGKPFFAAVSHYAVHTPLEAKPELVKKYKKKLQGMSFEGPEFTMTDDGRQKMLQNDPVYAAMIESVDISFGRIVEALKEAGVYQNTLIVFTSDHGGLSNSGINNKRPLATSNLPLRAGKGHCYEGGVKIPTIVKWKGNKGKGKTNSSVIINADVFPTVLDMLEIEDKVIAEMDGKSFKGALKGKRINEERSFFWHSPKGRPSSTGDINASVVRKGDYKLFHYFDRDSVALFDLKNDPYETEDISESHEALTKDLLKELKAWKETFRNEKKKKKGKEAKELKESKTAKAGKKPNVLFIIADDLRPELGCYGHPFVESPNIDELASEGVMFKKSYCNVPVCGASRASFLSGLRPTSDRFKGYSSRADEDAADVATMPEYFRKNGYTTISYGKVFHHLDDSPESWSEEAFRVDAAPGKKWRNYITEENLELAKKNNSKGNSREFPDVKEDAYYDGETAAKAVKTLKKLAADEEPFFMAVGFLKPHLPFNAPLKYKQLYDKKDISVPENFFTPDNVPGVALHTYGELRNYVDIPGTGDLDTLLAEDLIRSYYACVTYTDYCIGLLMDELERSGLDEHTIVVLIGDHGWNLGEHNLWAKHAHFNTSLQAPMIIKAPGMSNATTESLAEFVDIYPTLCNLCDLEAPNHLQGTSLVPVLKNPSKEVQEELFVRYQLGETIITKDFMYSRFEKEGRLLGEMLYDMSKDSQQNNNLVRDKAYQQQMEELRQRLQNK